VVSKPTVAGVYTYAKGGKYSAVKGVPELLKALRLISRQYNARKLVNSLAEMMVNQQRAHFLQKRDSSGKPWPPLAPLTILLRRIGSEGRSIRAARERKKGWKAWLFGAHGVGTGIGEPQPLRDTGRLFSSITKRVNVSKVRTSIEVGTSVKYALPQQFGATIKAGSPKQIPLGSYYQKFRPGKGRTPRTTMTLGRKKAIVIPPREFLYITPEESRLLAQRIVFHMKGIVRGKS